MHLPFAATSGSQHGFETVQGCASHVPAPSSGAGMLAAPQLVPTLPRWACARERAEVATGGRFRQPSFSHPVPDPATRCRRQAAGLDRAGIYPSRALIRTRRRCSQPARLSWQQAHWRHTRGISNDQKTQKHVFAGLGSFGRRLGAARLGNAAVADINAHLQRYPRTPTGCCEDTRTTQTSHSNTGRPSNPSCALVSTSIVAKTRSWIWTCRENAPQSQSARAHAKASWS